MHTVIPHEQEVAREDDSTGMGCYGLVTRLLSRKLRAVWSICAPGTLAKNVPNENSIYKIWYPIIWSIFLFVSAICFCAHAYLKVVPPCACMDHEYSGANCYIGKKPEVQHILAGNWREQIAHEHCWLTCSCTHKPADWLIDWRRGV